MPGLQEALSAFQIALDPDVIGVWGAALLTLMVYSYLVADNPLYRLAEHLLVGTAVGYAFVVAYHSVLRAQLVDPLIRDPRGNWPLVVPAVLGLLLLTKARTNIAWLGNVTVAYLMAVGSALAIGGALVGTIIPQVHATLVSLSPGQLGGGLPGLERALNNAILVLGTVSALMAFYFSAPGQRLIGRVWGQFVGGWARLGRWGIMMTFGAIFASTAVSRITLLISRVHFLLADWLQLIP